MRRSELSRYVLENGRQNPMIELLKKFYALKEQHKLTALSEMNTSAERNSDVWRRTNDVETVWCI